MVGEEKITKGWHPRWPQPPTTHRYRAQNTLQSRCLQKSFWHDVGELSFQNWNDFQLDPITFTCRNSLQNRFASPKKARSNIPNALSPYDSDKPERPRAEKMPTYPHPSPVSLPLTPERWLKFSVLKTTQNSRQKLRKLHKNLYKLSIFCCWRKYSKLQEKKVSNGANIRRHLTALQDGNFAHNFLPHCWLVLVSGNSLEYIIIIFIIIILFINVGYMKAAHRADVYLQYNTILDRKYTECQYGDPFE